MRGGARRIVFLLVAAAGAALAGLLPGCAVVGERYVLERQFSDREVGMIRKGQTTKKEILDLLGPPAALVRPGDAAADNVFQRFPAAAALAKEQLVYRYQASELTWVDVCLCGDKGCVCASSTPESTSRRLWVLIDERTGRVADHAVEETKREEKGMHVLPWLH